MRLVELIAGIANGEREEIEFHVPGAGTGDVHVTLRSAQYKTIDDPKKQLVVDEKTLHVPRAVWDNLIAALATQKVSKR